MTLEEAKAFLKQVSAPGYIRTAAEEVLILQAIKIVSAAFTRIPG